jgi:hypothetical protein
LATADGFESRGIDRIGDETVHAPAKSATPVQALRRMLNGYAYTLELSPANAAVANTAGADTKAGKLIRVSILGHVGDNIADASAPAAAAPGQPADSGALPAAGDMQAGPVHPVNHMLQSLARSTIPPSLGGPTGAETASASAQFGVVSGGVAGAPAATASTPDASSGATSSGAGATASSGGTSSGDGTATTTDMAALTRTASANLSALVQSLKAACPAGGKC